MYSSLSCGAQSRVSWPICRRAGNTLARASVLARIICLRWLGARLGDKFCNQISFNRLDPAFRTVAGLLDPTERDLRKRKTVVIDGNHAAFGIGADCGHGLGRSGIGIGRKPVGPALRAIYRARDAEAGMKALEEFEAGYWGQRYPAIALSWRRNWDHVIPFFAFPESVRRIIYTTNAIEALNSKLRRAVRTRGHFPSDDAAMKLLYLVLNHAAEEWKRPPREWTEAKTQFAVVFGERFVSQ